MSFAFSRGGPLSLDGVSSRKAINAVCCAYLADESGWWYQATGENISQEIPGVSPSAVEVRRLQGND